MQICGRNSAAIGKRGAAGLLSRLHIENVAVIENADLELDAGLNVLSGETGAGKSILIDSINLALGERVSRDIVRTGAEKAVVSALFSDISDAARHTVEALGFACEDDGSLLIQREISADGRGVCRVSGRPATVSMLREAGRALVNTHGQHDNQTLLVPERHISYLDGYAGLAGDLGRYRAAYDEMTALKRQLDGIVTDEGQKARRLDMLRFELDEIERADLAPGEEDELRARRTVCRNAGKIAEAVNDAFYGLSGGDDDEGAAALLRAASDSLNDIAELYPDVAPLAHRLNDAAYELEDCMEELRSFTGDMDIEPGELDRIEQRLDTIYRLRQKYGADVTGILQYGEKARAEIGELENSTERLGELQAKLAAARAKAKALAEALTKARTGAARSMEEKIRAELDFLEMAGVRFAVRLEPTDDLTPNGADRAEFQISANPGEGLKPIAKIASGGELSRIMLAIKNVLADKDDIETSIFDEIDTGVSGRAAYKIGLKLRQVAKGRQVVCVTHLAQIAAEADRHILIEKSVEGGSTRTHLTVLDFAGRRAELARIIGGAGITELTLQNAEEMLVSAGQNPQ